MLACASDGSANSYQTDDETSVTIVHFKGFPAKMGGKYFFLPGCKRTVICIKFIHVSDQHGPSSEHNCHIKESQIESKVERLKRESANTNKTKILANVDLSRALVFHSRQHCGT